MTVTLRGGRSPLTTGCASSPHSTGAGASVAKAVARIFDDGEPNPGVYHLLRRHELRAARSDSRPCRPRELALAFRLKLLLAAGFAPHLAGCAADAASASTSSASPGRGRRGLRRLRGELVPARRGRARVHGRGAGTAAGRDARRSASGAFPG